MPQVTFDNGITFYEIPDEVHKYLEGYYRKSELLSAENKELRESIAEYRIKRETASNKPTKATKIQMWEAMKRMFWFIEKTEQKSLFR